MMNRLLLGLLLVAGSAPALADPLMKDDFQTGKAQGWAGRGAGDVRVTDYQGNFSLRLQARAEALTAFSAARATDIVVSADVAALGLAPRDACLLDVSADRGATWTEIGRIGKGRDDGVTLHRLRGAQPALAGKDPVFVRLSARLTAADASCWFDNVEASGRIIDPAAQAPLDPAFLTGDAPLAQPRDLAMFAPRAGAPAGPAIAGRLRVTPDAAGGGSRVIRDEGNYAANGRYAVPPPIDIALVSDGDALIPTTRGPIPSDHPDWEWIVEPGKVWTDPADDGWSRAALPVALQERNANCTHNGMLTFLYRADGSTSRAAWEIAGETCAYFKVDLWGVAPARLMLAPVADRQAIVAAYRDEVAARLPVRPIEEIGQAFAGVDASLFGSAMEVDPETMTAFGVVAGGVHWVGGCNTRHGRYPFCDVLDLPSYSLAKSIFGGLGLMRLEMLYPGAATARIGDHVPACAGDAKWSDVTLGNALDMATGNFGRPGYDADEGSARMLPFFIADTHEERARLACAMFPRAAAPGTQWAYHTVDTYLLGTAMQDLLRRRRGSDADIYRDLVADPLWRKLRLSPVTAETKRSYDADRQPFTGWGLTLHRDDIARIALFLLGGGQIDGRPAVDAQMLAAALQRDPADRGLEAGMPGQRYNNGFWAWNVASAIGCGMPVWVPFMSGYGGITVAMFPNGVVYYYVSDGGDHVWRRAAEGAAMIQPMCAR